MIEERCIYAKNIVDFRKKFKKPHMAHITHYWHSVMHQNTSALLVTGYKKEKWNFNNETEVSVPTLDLMRKDRCPPTAICFFMTLK